MNNNQLNSKDTLKNWIYEGVQDKVDFFGNPYKAYVYRNDTDFNQTEYYLVDTDIANFNGNIKLFCENEVISCHRSLQTK